MSLLEDIKAEISSQKKTKAQKILEVKDEIILMLENKISLKKQRELLLKNRIVEKITASEYRNILIKHFGYKTNKQKTTKTETKTEIKQKPKTNPAAKSAKEILSQDINLLQ